jgi:uncharacterized protein (TIGR03435 family)
MRPSDNFSLYEYGRRVPKADTGCGRGAAPAIDCLRFPFGPGTARCSAVVRAIAAVVAGLVVVLLILLGVSVRLSPPARKGWKEFRISPASGMSTMINPGVMRADGVTLLFMLSVAYRFPTARIVAPGWVARTRYAIVAEAPGLDRELFEQLFQEELKARFELETHVEKRAFDVFVLSAGPKPEFPDGGQEEPWNSISNSSVELRGASMDRVAGAVQSVLGKPVMNETGIDGVYHVEFAWGEDRLATVTAALRNKFGLDLRSAKRDLDALVVDRIQPDGALSVLDRVGRMTSGAPRGFRRAISKALTIR